MNRRKFMASLGIGVASCAVTGASTPRPDAINPSGGLSVEIFIRDNRKFSDNEERVYGQGYSVSCRYPQRDEQCKEIVEALRHTLWLLTNNCKVLNNYKNAVPRRRMR